VARFHGAGSSGSSLRSCSSANGSGIHLGSGSSLVSNSSVIHLVVLSQRGILHRCSV